MDGASPYELLGLDVVDGAGRTTKSAVAIYDAVPARVILTTDDVALEEEGGNLLQCLIGIRRQLEAKGFNLCCQGARPDVWPSGQLLQFTNGRFGYVLASEPIGRPFAQVDMFAPADVTEIGTVEQQRENVFRFYGLRRQRS